MPRSTKPVMLGLWIIIAAALSTIITVPLGFGAASGVVFGLGMLILWIAASANFVLRITLFAKSKRNGS